MNKYLDFDSKKFLILLLVICVVFFVVIIKAFEYLPNSEDNIKQPGIESINKTSSETSKEEQEEQSEQTEEASNKKTLNVNLQNQTDSIDLEEIDAPKGVKTEPIAENSSSEDSSKKAELTPEQKIAQSLYTANQCRINGQYEKALGEYQKIIASTSDKNVVAVCYEGIATIYAAKHKYGTALSYASRAYNMSPSSSRELLLARIYYKTGDIDKATKRINNVLHRDFTEDK